MDGDTRHPHTYRAEIDNDGAVTLPASILAHLKVAEGDRLYMYPSLDGGLRLRKVVDDDFSRRLDALRGVAGPGPSTDEMLEMTRGEPNF